jgi:SAM-dependent methyltransferase
MLDKILRLIRFKKAAEFIPSGMVVFDIGCGDGNFFRYLNKRMKYGFGCDKIHKEPKYFDNYILTDQVAKEKVNVVTMIATIEHLEYLEEWVVLINRTLLVGGVVIITVPEPKVDKLLKLFGWMLIDRTWKQHSGISTDKIKWLFRDFDLICHNKFLFGFNNLLVFKKC